MKSVITTLEPSLAVSHKSKHTLPYDPVTALLKFTLMNQNLQPPKKLVMDIYSIFIHGGPKFESNQDILQ